MLSLSVQRSICFMHLWNKKNVWQWICWSIQGNVKSWVLNELNYLQEKQPWQPIHLSCQHFILLSPKITPDTYFISAVAVRHIHHSQVKKKIKIKYRPPVARTHLWTRDGGANTPCFGGHLKYLTPPTEPSFLPLGLSSLMPNQKPGWTQGQSRNGLKHSHNCTSLTNSRLAEHFLKESSTFIKSAPLEPWSWKSQVPGWLCHQKQQSPIHSPIVLLRFVLTLSCTLSCSLPT